LSAAPFTEPDRGNELTAVAFGPGCRKMLSKLPLALRSLVYRHGMPNRLSEKDVGFLEALNQEIWDRSTDRFGSVHSFPNRELSKAEKEQILELASSHGLPCVLHSGVYGQLSMSVYDHSGLPGVPPEPVLHVSSKHFGLKQTFKEWRQEFEFMSALTHSDENRRTLAFYGLPKPGPMSDYEY